MRHNGYAIHVRPERGSTLEYDGEGLALRPFHLHTPSEHTLHGERFAAEAHFVHCNPDGALTVVALFVREGKRHPAFSALVDVVLPEDGATSPPVSFDPTRLLPEGRTPHVLYDGSLTTPRYTEGVRWIVLTQPVELSTSQITAFADSTPFDARDLQPLHGRRALRSR